jgi:hypothetical protein
MLTPPGVGARAVRRPSARRTFGSLLVATVLAAVAAGGWWWWTERASSPPAGSSRAGATASCPAVTTAPAAPAATTVRVNVFNATERRGLAAAVASQLRRRGFRVGKIANDPAKRPVAGVAEVRSSVAGAAAARTVAAQIGRYVAVRDQRRDATVDLVLGSSFTALRPPAAARAALAPSPATRPAGC